MTVSAGGLVRLRKHQFSRQEVKGTAVPATRAYPYKGVPDPDLGWTDQDVDAGSIDPVAPPYRGPENLTAALTSPALSYNDLVQDLSGVFGGNVQPTGTGPDYTWDHAPASTSMDPVDYFTYEFGDDVETDWDQYVDGIIEQLEITGPVGLGALTASRTWRFGDYASTGSTDFAVTGTVPTPDLAVATDDAIIYLKDATVAIASTVAGLGAGQISDAVYSFTLRVSGDVGQKRWANGTQSFGISAFARETRLIELELVLAKTEDTVGVGSESDAWMSKTAVNRYAKVTFTSLVNADTATPYSWTFTMPLRYYTRANTDEGGNTTITLTGHAFYDPDDFEGVFKSTIVNTLSEADLGALAEEA